MTFNPEQQAAHCRELADLLDTERVKDHYNHGVWFGTRTTLNGVARDGVHKPDAVAAGTFDCDTVACALGWAAVAGIGGLTARHALPNHLTPVLPASRAGYNPAVSADIVFGPGAYTRIFSGLRDARGANPAEDRQISIELLRNQAALLESQPELA